MPAKELTLIQGNTRSSGGLEKQALRIARAFHQTGWKVHCIAQTPPTLSSPGIEWVIPPSPLSSIGFLRLEQFDRFVRGWLHSHPADLIFGMGRTRYQTHIRAGNGVHAAYLESRKSSEGPWKFWQCLYNPLHRKILKIEKEAFHHPELRVVLTNSLLVKHQILKYFSVDPQKIHVLHNGVEWMEMASAFSSSFSQKNESDSIELLFVGNGYRRKGLDLLLNALSHLLSLKWRLTIIGKDKDLHKFQQKAAKLKMLSRTRFLGPQSSLIPFYQEADVLVIPSFYDPFANVTVEALAMGLFVVSSKQNGGAEILNGSTGIVIEDLQSTDSLVYALTQALQQKKTEKNARMIRESVRHLDFSKQMDTLLQICEVHSS